MMKIVTLSIRPLTLAAAVFLLAPAAFGQTPTLYASESDGLVTSFAAAGAAPVTYANVNGNAGAPPNDLDGLAFDTANNLFVTDFDYGAILKIVPGGAETRFAVLPSGSPQAIAFNSLNGNLYVSNAANSAPYNGNINQITPQGFVSSFAPTINIENPAGIAFDAGGNLYVLGLGNTTNKTQINRITPGGSQSVFATFNGRNPGGLAFNAGGILFASDQKTGVISEIVPDAGGLTGTASTFASLGTSAGPGGLAFDPSGNLYAAEVSPTAHGIEEISPDGKTLTAYANDPNDPFALAFGPLTFPVPEPSTWAMGGVGAGLLGLMLRRRARA